MHDIIFDKIYLINTFTKKKISGSNKFHLVSIYKDNKGSLWFGTSDYDYLSLTGKALKDSKSSKKEQTKARPEN
jgi:hypothetical protein